MKSAQPPPHRHAPFARATLTPRAPHRSRAPAGHSPSSMALSCPAAFPGTRATRRWNTASNTPPQPATRSRAAGSQPSPAANVSKASAPATHAIVPVRRRRAFGFPERLYGKGAVIADACHRCPLATSCAASSGSAKVSTALKRYGWRDRRTMLAGWAAPL